MLGIVAALPREVAEVVKGVRAEPALLQRGVHLYRLQGAVVVAAGMGAERATAAVSAALASAPVTMLVSTGLAGACVPSLVPGSVVEAARVIDVRTGESYQTEAASAAIVLATSFSIASVQEKARLAGSYGAALVDMEAATVARMARVHGHAFRAVKGISDAHDFELASLARFEGKHGTFRTGRFALHTAVRPHHWRKTVTLGRHSKRALAALNARLAEIIASER